MFFFIDMYGMIIVVNNNVFYENQMTFVIFNIKIYTVIKICMHNLQYGNSQCESYKVYKSLLYNCLRFITTLIKGYTPYAKVDWLLSKFLKCSAIFYFLL